MKASKRMNMFIHLHLESASRCKSKIPGHTGLNLESASRCTCILNPLQDASQCDWGLSLFQFNWSILNYSNNILLGLHIIVFQYKRPLIVNRTPDSYAKPFFFFFFARKAQVTSCPYVGTLSSLSKRRAESDTLPSVFGNVILLAYFIFLNLIL